MAIVERWRARIHQCRSRKFFPRGGGHCGVQPALAAIHQSVTARADQIGGFRHQCPVKLNWSSVSGVQLPDQARGDQRRKFSTIAPGVTGTNYTDIAITNGTTVYYVVTALNAYGESVPSNVASVPVPFPRLSARAASAQCSCLVQPSELPDAVQHDEFSAAGGVVAGDQHARLAGWLLADQLVAG